MSSSPTMRSGRWKSPTPSTAPRGSEADVAPGSSADVDGDDLDRVVAVAEPVPRGNLGLRVAGGVGRAGAQALPAASGGVPLERPALPLVRALRRLELGGQPVAFPGEADLDLRDRAGAGPRLAAHDLGAGRDHRAGGRMRDTGADAHEGDALGRAVGPLVHVVAGLELAGERLGQDVDVLEPLDRGDGIPVRNDQAEGRAVVGVE